MDEWMLAFIVILTAAGASRAPSKAFPLELSTRERKTSCLFGGKYYPANSSFVTPDCAMQCYCMGNGATSCMDLCSPLPKGECPLGMRIHDEREPAGPRESNCYCIKRYCVAAYCYTKKFQKYKIGESYRRGNCSDICTCEEDGGFKCGPACPKKDCPPGFKRKKGRKKLIFGCRCQNQRCIPKRRRACKYNGRIYTNKRYFETANCQSKCRCKRNGALKCSPLCPATKTPNCRPNEKLEQVKVPPAQVTKARCQCLKQVCVPFIAVHNRLRRPKLPKLRTCKVRNRTLMPGQPYITEECSERCRCTTFGHLVCLPMCISPSVTCSSDEERLLVKRPVGRSKCSCTRTTCRPRTSLDKRENECKVDEHTFTHGIEYVDRNCTKHCECTKAGQAQCRPLCPVTKATYCPNGLMKFKKVLILNAPWCSCTVTKCTAIHDNRSIDISEM